MDPHAVEQQMVCGAFRLERDQSIDRQFSRPAYLQADKPEVVCAQRKNERTDPASSVKLKLCQDVLDQGAMEIRPPRKRSNASITRCQTSPFRWKSGVGCASADSDPV